MDTRVAIPQMGFLTSRISIQTERSRDFVDLTEEIEAQLEASGYRSGLVVITSLHTTAALVINEHEPELLKDLNEFLSRLAPESEGYLHNAVPCLPGEGPNAHSHCQALLLHASVTVPIIDSRLQLGRFQRIFLVELDCARPRQVTVSLIGA